MRRCLIGDLIEAAAVVAAFERGAQAACCQRLIAQADAAHRYAKRFGRAHPIWGNGSLMARALLEGALLEGALLEGAQPVWPQGSIPFLQALGLVSQSLAAHKAALHV